MVGAHVRRIRRKGAGPPGRWRRALVGAALGALVVALATLAADPFFAHGARLTWRADPADTEASPDEPQAAVPKSGDHLKTRGRRGRAPRGRAKGKSRAQEPRHRRGGSPQIVARTIEHRPHFANKHRALSRYVQAWPFDAWGVPQRTPRLDATLEAWLEVPEGPPRIVRAESPNETSLRVDGGPATRQPPLPPGRHYLEVSWKGSFRGNASLALLWGTGPDALTPIPHTALTPPGGALPWSRRVFLAIAAAVLVLLSFSLFVALLARTRGARARRVGVVLAGFLVLFGIGLRSWDYAVMPEFTENLDELYATWNGFSILEDGTTRGWTLWPAAYGSLVELEEVPYFRQRPIINVTPYFEHPPLMHLLVGAAAKLGGATHYTHARLKHTRIVPIALSVFTMLLLFLLARRLCPRGPAPWVTLALYAFLPLVAIQERAIKEEALLDPLVLASLLFHVKWREEGEKRSHLLASAILAGICPLVKVPGLFFLAALVVLVALRRRFHAAALTALVGGAIASLFLVYGAAIDWHAFWLTQTQQAAGRPAHFNLFPRFFADPSIIHNLVGQGWLLFLWAAYLMRMADPRQRFREVLLWPLVAYLVPLALASGNWTFGWYYMPLYLFQCVAAGAFLTDLWNRPRLLGGFLFVGLFVLYTLNFVVPPDTVKAITNWADVRRAVTVVLLFGLAPFALCELANLVPFRWLARGVLVLGFGTFLVVSSLFVLRYEEYYETYRAFDTLQFFGR